MFRFFLHAAALIILLLALFSLTFGYFDFGPSGTLTVLDARRVPVSLVMGTWVLEAFGLIALFLLIEGRTGSRWLDGLLVGWVAWIFRGPLLVVTIVVAAGQPQAPWFRLIFGWWVLYSVCGLVLAMLARRQSRALAVLEEAVFEESVAPALLEEPAAPEPAAPEPVERPAEEG